MKQARIMVVIDRVKKTVNVDLVDPESLESLGLDIDLDIQHERTSAGYIFEDTTTILTDQIEVRLPGGGS